MYLNYEKVSHSQLLDRITPPEQNVCHVLMENRVTLASFPGHSQILSHSHGEKSREGLGSLLRHGSEMVDLVSA